jgi:UDP-hydrolysing UDP-N-acetyl-D-glucosamine 2-epimerase
VTPRSAAQVRKIAVVTGSRADYGLLRPTLRALSSDARFELQLLVAAMHLSEQYGLTVREIDDDGFPIAARVETPDVQAPEDLGRAFSEAIAGFGAAFARLGPDFLVVLGDRHEILSAALAATGFGIAIAHVHGGELSEGSVDDSLRHCVTKLAHIHFVANRLYGERVCQLGEQPDHVYVVGAPALEVIRGLELLDREQLADALGEITLRRPLVVLTLHPASLDPDAAAGEAHAVVRGVARVIGKDGTVVITLPNDDLGNVQTRRALLEYAEEEPNVFAFQALGQLRYLSLLSHADAMVGNSSSGLIEAPAFDLPTINVGDRQRGRLRASNVLDCESSVDAVANTLTRALNSNFRASLAGMENPYGSRDTSARILDVLASTNADEVRDKRFFDLPEGQWRSEIPFGDGIR